MSDLRTLFISQSYTSLIHTSNDAAVPTGSYIELEDGSGNSLGIEVNRDGNFKVQGELSASLLNGIGNVNSYSSSVDGRITALETSSAANITPLNQFTASQLTINDGYNQFTESAEARLDSIEIATASYNDKFDTIGSQSGSWGSGGDVTALNDFTASQLTINSGYNSYTQSTDGRLDSLETETGSLINQIDTKLDTGSYLVDSASFDSRIDGIVVGTGFATTGSNTFNGSQIINTTSTSALVVRSSPTDFDPVIIEGGTDFITKFTPSRIKASIFETNRISGSWGGVGYVPGGLGSGGIVGIYSHLTGSNSEIEIRHSALGSVAKGGTGTEPGYSSFRSDPSNFSFESRIVLRGTEMFLLASTGSKQTTVNVDGAVSASSFTGSFKGDGSGLENLPTFDTGALLETASVNLNTITFTKADASTFDLTIDTGSGGGTTDITALNEFTASANQRLDSLETFTSSLSTDYVGTTEFNTYTQSVDTEQTNQDNRLDSIELATSSYDAKFDYIATQSGSWDTTIDTGSFATTGSNSFSGSQEITGSVNGNVESLTIASSTASIDCSQGNFFTLTLPTGSNTHITATNIVPGMTITLEISQASSGTGTATFDTSSFSFPRLNQPSITLQSSAIDVATFVTFNSNKLNGIISNDFI